MRKHQSPPLALAMLAAVFGQWRSRTSAYQRDHIAHHATPLMRVDAVGTIAEHQ
jgi:hypothetical protein